MGRRIPGRVLCGWTAAIAVGLALGACSDDGGNESADPRIAEWLTKTGGQQLTYTATFSCGICDIGGIWRITERDGDIVTAEFLEDRAMRTDASPLTLTEALELAKRADGPVVVVSSSSNAIDFTVDSDPSAIDDEFGYAVADVTIGG